MRLICVLSLLIGVVSSLNELEFGAFKARQFTEPNSMKKASVSIDGRALLSLTVRSNGIPDHETGKQSAGIKEQNLEITIPNLADNSRPAVASTCLPVGLVGVAINGIPIYNPYTVHCCNVADVPASTYDQCWGQVDSSGTYYYTTPPLCLAKQDCGNASGLIGVAIDGFPIYGPIDETGKLLTSADLDACHGRKDRYQKYRYHATFDFPYMIGCFSGVPPPGYAPTVCGCSSLATSCEGEKPPVLPSDSVSRKRRSTTESVQGYLKNVAQTKCCKPGEKCEFVYNPYGGSSGNTLSPTYATLFATLATNLLVIVFLV